MIQGSPLGAGVAMRVGVMLLAVGLAALAFVALISWAVPRIVQAVLA